MYGKVSLEVDANQTGFDKNCASSRRCTAPSPCHELTRAVPAPPPRHELTPAVPCSDLLNGSVPASGNTRFNISVTVTRSGGGVLPPLVAHVHSARCSAVPPGGQHYLHNSSMPDDALPATWSPGVTYGTNTLSALLSFRNASYGTMSTGQPWLANFDAALSVVIHDPAGQVACSNLVPALPDLPEEYSVTMEANFGFGKAFTMVMKEYASTALGKRAIVMHSNTTAQAQVQDLVTNMTYTLVQNATYPNGVCTASRCIPNPLQPCLGTLQGLASYYSIGSCVPHLQCPARIRVLTPSIL